MDAPGEVLRCSCRGGQVPLNRDGRVDPAPCPLFTGRPGSANTLELHLPVGLHPPIVGQVPVRRGGLSDTAIVPVVHRPGRPLEPPVPSTCPHPQTSRFMSAACTRSGCAGMIRSMKPNFPLSLI